MTELVVETDFEIGKHTGFAVVEGNYVVAFVGTADTAADVSDRMHYRKSYYH